MMTEEPVAFGDLLRRLRKAVGLTQEELADRAGLSQRGINDLERGARRSPHKDTALRLADALNLAGDDRAAFFAAARRSPPPVERSTPSPAAVGIVVSSADAADVEPATFPSGTVTFLFTDIEGSTALLQRLGKRYVAALDGMRAILRAAFSAQHGSEVDTQGDSFLAAFLTARDGLAAAAQAQRALATHAWPAGEMLRVRMGLHTGAPLLVGERYIGLDVHRAARIGSAAHGGEVLLSSATAELARGAPDGLPDGTELRDLGEHRLKDLRAPERLWRLLVAGLPGDFPLPRTLDRHAHNLPIQPTPLLGRSREVSEVSRLLRSEDVWLVTVTGPPGVGKTRLSLQVAAELTSATDVFPDGVWFVRLARLSDPTLVIATIAREFGLRDNGARPIAQMLWDYLEAHHMLLVLDNFEHVVAAASDLSELRQHAPGVRLLVTSRTPLRLRGEREYALAALPVPAPLTSGAALRPEQVGVYASVRLFTERAQAAVADFAVTAATAPALAGICARLDGLPLALELAAARVKVLPVDTLLTRLERALPLLSGGPRDLDERQQTMRATLAWSDELLSVDERALFRRLAVFAGGAPLEWIEDVCLAPEGAAPLTLDVLAGLEALLNQSLIQRWDGSGGQGQPRYSMLHVVREYALEQLEASGEAEALRRAHALACLRLGEQYGPFAAYGYPAWLDRMGAERDNLRAAMTWTLARGEPELGMRLAISAAQYDLVRGDARECDRWLTRMLRLDAVSPDPSGEAAHDRQLARCTALRWAFEFADMVGDSDRWEKLLDEYQALSRAAGDQVNATLALYERTREAIMDDYDRAIMENRATSDSTAHYAALRQVIADIQGVGDDALQSYVLTWIGFDLISLPKGVPEHLAEALALTKEGVSLAQRCGHRYAEFRGFEALAYQYTRGNDMPAARAAISHALEIITTYHYEGVMDISLGSLAAMAAHEGRVIRAARLAGAQVPLREDRGSISTGILALEPIPDAYAALGPEAWARYFAEGQALSRADVIAEAWREARGEMET